LGELKRYVEALSLNDNKPGRDLDTLPVRRFRYFAPSVKQKVKEAGTWAVAPWSRLQVRSLVRRPLLLNLGCGYTRLTGWVNIDLWGLRSDLAWDLRKGLPFPTDSADAIFNEHLLEHLPLRDVLPLLRDCVRVLRSGGVLRVGVPDAERYIRDYVEPSGFIDNFRPGRPTPLLALAEAAYCYDHRSLWDGHTLTLAFAEAGLANVSVMPFGESSLIPAPDSPHRETETVYVEGVKPS
jgi:SAM-dependent methyltransferase